MMNCISNAEYYVVQELYYYYYHYYAIGTCSTSGKQPMLCVIP